MSEKIPGWAWERVREIMGYSADTEFRHWQGYGNLARYIAAHEEPPIDPLLIEAREIVASWWEANPPKRFSRSSNPDEIRDGNWDNCAEMTQALAALKRGIELGKSQ